jgi:DNA-binding beta-propeller fold protein YncE
LHNFARPWVIDGTTHELTKVEIGGIPGLIVVNPVTNKIYVGYLAVLRGKSVVAVIDGATNQVTKVTVRASPYDLAVNTVTNKVYVPNYYGGKVSVIDGFTAELALAMSG